MFFSKLKATVIFFCWLVVFDMCLAFFNYFNVFSVTCTKLYYKEIQVAFKENPGCI